MFCEGDKQGCEIVLVTDFEVRLVADIIKKSVKG